MNLGMNFWASIPSCKGMSFFNAASGVGIARIHFKQILQVFSYTKINHLSLPTIITFLPLACIHNHPWLLQCAYVWRKSQWNYKFCFSFENVLKNYYPTCSQSILKIVTHKSILNKHGDGKQTPRAFPRQLWFQIFCPLIKQLSPIFGWKIWSPKE